jgi:septum formation protein
MSLFGDIKILLASKSPRRRQLVQELGLPFEVVDVDVEEKLSHRLSPCNTAKALAKLKADAFSKPLAENEILLTADTIVVLDGKILGKPKSEKEAFEMIRSLSGRQHYVYTGVCLKSSTSLRVFAERTTVHFRHLTDEAIRYYIDTYRPMDKAGAYGIQEWIGLFGVERIGGCFYNVMGLPVPRICKELEMMMKLSNSRMLFFEMQRYNAYSRLASKKGILYIHVNVDLGGAASGLQKDIPRYMFLYDKSSHELKCYVDKSKLIVRNYYEIKQKVDFELVETKFLSEDVAIEELFDCNASIRGWDCGGYSFYVSYLGKEHNFFIDNSEDDNFKFLSCFFDAIREM